MLISIIVISVLLGLQEDVPYIFRHSGPADFPIESDGIGPVRLEKKLSSLPESCPGLYAIIDNSLTGLDYHRDTLIVPLTKNVEEKIPLQARIFLYERDKLLDSAEFDEEVVCKKRAGDNDTIIRLTVLDPQSGTLKGDPIFSLFPDKKGIVKRIRILSPKYQTYSGLRCNASLYELYRHGAELLIDGEDQIHVECDGVRFGGFISSLDEDFARDMRKGMPEVRIKVTDSMLAELDEMELMSLRINKATYIEIASGVIPTGWRKSTGQEFQESGESSFVQYVLTEFDANRDRRISLEEALSVRKINYTAQYSTGTRLSLDLSSLSAFREATELRLYVSRDLRNHYTRTRIVGSEEDIRYKYFRREESFSSDRIRRVEASITEGRIYTSISMVEKLLGWTEYRLSETRYIRVNRSWKEKMRSSTVTVPPRFKLDLAGLTKLRSVYCDEMFLGVLKGLECPDLEMLHCSINSIRALDISRCPQLQILTVEFNLLESLDIGNNGHLLSLNLSGNRLRTLDTGQNTALRRLICPDNRLSELDLSSNGELTELVLSNNQIRKLDVVPLNHLATLLVDGNPIDSLDLSSCTDLRVLDISGTRIDTLDISHCLPLEEFFCDEGLKYLKMSENQHFETIPESVTLEVVPRIKEMKQHKALAWDAGMPIALEDPVLKQQLLAYADQNKDGFLTAGEAFQVHELRLVDGNDFEYLSDLTPLRFFTSLERFSITGDGYGNLSGIDLSPFEGLESFTCQDIGLMELDLSSNTQLRELNIIGCKIARLDITPCPQLKLFNLSFAQSYAGTLHLRLTASQKKALTPASMKGPMDLLVPKGTLLQVENR